MDSRRSALYQAIGPVLRGAGFERRGSAWYRSTGDSTQVVHLQRSDYSDQFYVNLACALTALTSARYPAEHHCHIRTRLTALVPDQAASRAGIAAYLLSPGARRALVSRQVRESLNAPSSA